MGLDRIISRFRIRKRDISSKVDLDNFIEKEFYYNPRSLGLYMIFPPWHRGFIFRNISHNLKRKIQKLGYSYLEYKVQSGILSTDYKLTERCFKTIQETAMSDLLEKEKQYGFKEFNIIGISTGGIGALMTTNNNARVNKLIAVVPGHCLAESMWNGVRTQHLRKAFEDKGITLEKLKEYWKDLTPVNNINGLGDKELYIYLSKADESVPYYYGRKLVDSMRRIGLNPRVRENKYLGHYGTVLAFYLFPKDI